MDSFNNGSDDYDGTISDDVQRGSDDLEVLINNEAQSGSDDLIEERISDNADYSDGNIPMCCSADNAPSYYSVPEFLKSMKIDGSLFSNPTFMCCPWAKFRRPNTTDVFKWKFFIPNNSNIPIQDILVLWCSWVIKGPTKSFYFVGDTGYYDALFKTIGKMYGPFDLAVIPIGGYEPRFITRFQHVNPEEAVRIHRDVQSKQSIGVQWGTFELTNEVQRIGTVNGDNSRSLFS